MSKFTDIWDATYEGIPLNSEQESLGAGRIRSIKTDIRVRMQQDHSWAGDDNDGYHNSVTLLGQASAPNPSPANGGPAGSLVCLSVNGNLELYFKDSSGRLVQLTAAGALNLAVASPGDVKATFASTADPGWVFARGQAQSTTDPVYAALFAAIGYIGGGSGGTFIIPDLRSRTIFGLDPGNATGRLTNPTLNGGGINAGALGQVGGAQEHTLDTNELTTHSHPVIDNGHGHTYHNVTVTTGNGSGGNPQPGDAGNASTSIDGTGISLGATGGTVPFNIVPPGIVANWEIKL